MSEILAVRIASLADITTMKLYLHDISTGALLNTGGDLLTHVAGGLFHVTVDEDRTGLGHMYAVVCDGAESPANIVWDGWLQAGQGQIVSEYPAYDAVLQTVGDSNVNIVNYLTTVLDPKIDAIQEDTDLIPAIKTNTDLVPAIKTNTDMIPEIRDNVASIPTIKGSTDLLPAIKGSTDLIPAIKTETDKIASIKVNTDLIPGIVGMVGMLPEIKEATDLIPGLAENTDLLLDIKVSTDLIPGLQTTIDLIPDIKINTDLIPAIKGSTDLIPNISTADPSDIALALLLLDWTTIASPVPHRSALNAFRHIRNRWEIVGTHKIVYKEDNTTPAFTTAITGGPDGEIIADFPTT